MTSSARRPASERHGASFAADARHELALHVPARPCCQLSELEGVVAAARTFETEGSLAARLTSSAVARKVVRLGRLLTDAGDSSEHHFIRGTTHLRPTYVVTIDRRAGTPLADLRTDAPLPEAHHCRRAYLRGAFIASGVVSLTAAGTHLELALTAQAPAARVMAALADLGITARQRRRGGRWLVYLKGADDVVLALKAMGASQAVLRFENDRILREVRAHANRQANSETANLRRTVASSVRQAKAVRRLRETGMLDAQPQAIREIAAVRLAMPSASLEEIARRLTLSKSAVNARLRRLVAVADKEGLID